jgi:hypothetical protein
MAAQKEKEQRFDQVKLQGMHEPLTVRVEKMRGNVRQPIELPSKGSELTGFSPPGTNWTRDEVLQLENFVLTKWSGGGYYEFTVTDSKGDRMIWQGVWDPRVYPERIPPNTADAAVIGAAQTSMPVAGPQLVPSSVQPFGSSQQSGWPPNGNALGYNNPPHTGPLMSTPVNGYPAQQPQQQQPQPQQPQQPQQMMPGYPQPVPSQAPPMWNPNGQQPQQAQPPWGWQQQPMYNAPPAGYGRSRYGFDDDAPPRRSRFAHVEDDDTKEKFRALEQRLQQAELEKKELEYKQALERQQTLHVQQMTQLQDEMRRLGEGRNKSEDDEVRRLREEREQERQRAQTEQAAARERAQTEQAAMQRQIMEQQLLAMRQANDTQMAALREQLGRLAEAPKSETDEFRRLREEQDRQAREFERQRQEGERRLEVERAERERERERYDRERRDEILQRELKETREATERRFEQMQTAAASSANRHDPMIEMLKESARASSENMREIARMQQASTDKMSQFMVAPAQLAAIMKDNNNGADGVIRNIIGSVSEIGNLYKNAAETIMNMSGGGGDPPAARLIQEGIGRASEVAERFLAVKRDQVISEGKVKTAEAMRDQTKIQTDAALRSQAMQVQAMQAQAARQWSPPPPVANANANANAGGGLGGAQPQPSQARPQANGQPQQQQQRPQAAQPQTPQAPKPKHVGPIDDQVPEPKQPKRTGPIDDQTPEPPVVHSTGPSEEEVFGVALESVLRLRRGVAEGKLTPDKTIDAVLQGVEHVVTNNIIVPAFVLFQQERWADFIDIMLPEASADFKVECVRILMEEVEVSPDGSDADGEPAT